MGKRTLAMVVYDRAAAQQRQRDAVVPYVAAQPADAEPINAVPLNAMAPPRTRRALVPAPEEPACLRKHILPALGLREDLPVHFIDRKRVTDTDLNPQQNRFRIPSDGTLGRLRSILTVDELDSANLLKDAVSKSMRQPEDDDTAADKEGELEQGWKKRKRRGKVHGGLPVKLVDLAAGASGELLLSRWESSHGTIVKGGGYMDYIRRCSFKEHDVVDIWAFKQRTFRLLGTTILDESPLHVFVAKNT